MKHIWKIKTIIASLVLFSAIHLWMNASFREMYQKTKDTASSMKSKVKEKYTSVKDTMTGVKNTVGGAVSSGLKYIIGEPTAVTINPYKQTVAQVRIGNTLNDQERAYLTKRIPKVKTALEKMLGRSLDGKQIPKIAIVCSGGGYRAMLGSLGGLLASDKIGLLDATTYITALSGGTWAVASWLSTGLSLPEFKQYIQKTIEKDIHVSSTTEAKNIIDMLSVKLLFDEPITTVDIYGGLLANRLLNKFGTDCQRVYLSQQAKRIENANVPYPIYTAIDAREAVAREPHWFEFTPHEIGCPYFGVYVPTWAYGRKFEKGASTDFAPEQTLGFHLGTFGSAFGVHFGRAWEEIEAKIPGNPLKSYVEKKLVERLTGKRITTSWSEIFNFMYGISDQELMNRPTIKFVDAGIDFNLPYPPISGERPERQADIIILLDMSGGLLGTSLKKMESYAQRKRLRFPKIDYTGIETQTLSVFKNESDPSVPTILYIPRISDAQLWQTHKSDKTYSDYSSIEDFDFEKCTNESGPCATSKFKYNSETSRKLIDQMEFNVLINKNKIIEAINWVIDQK